MLRSYATYHLHVMSSSLLSGASKTKSDVLEDIARHIFVTPDLLCELASVA